MFHILLVSPAKSWRGLRGSKFYIVNFLPHPLPTNMCQVTSPALYIKIVVRSHFFLNCGFFVFQNTQGDNYAEKWILAHVHRRRRFSSGCPAFFGESSLLGWPTGIVILHTYFCLVIRVSWQWEFQLRGRQLEDLVTELRTQWLHPYLLFQGDGLAFLCFLSQVSHQLLSIVANDGEHLDTKYNST